MLRRTGSTTYLINSMIMNPNVILIVKTEQMKLNIKRKYYNTLRNLSLFDKVCLKIKHLIDKIFNNKTITEPIIITEKELKIMKGFSPYPIKPIIFDNSCFY